jgi:hypothetical protein
VPVALELSFYTGHEMLRLWLVMIVGALLVIGSGVVSSMARAQAGTDPAAVITAYEMARNRRDLDAAMAYFADDASITQRSQVYSGRDAIRKFLEAASARSRFIVVTERHTNGNNVSWTERSGGQNDQLGPSPQQGNAIRQGGLNVSSVGTFSASSATGQQSGTVVPSFALTVEAVVQDGKIHSMTYLAPNQAGRVDPALEGRAQLPATAGLAAVVAVMLGVLMVASLGGFGKRRLAAESSLQGRLMQDLQGWSSGRE